MEKFWIQDPGWKKFGSGMGKSRIRDPGWKNFGSGITFGVHLCLQDSQSDRAALSRPSLVLVTWLLDSTLDRINKVIGFLQDSLIF
jgi:hypothetical protein